MDGSILLLIERRPFRFPPLFRFPGLKFDAWFSIADRPLSGEQAVGPKLRLSSGFNSAIARTGGLIATALSGPVIAQSGVDLIVSFRAAAMLSGMLAA
jgi:hypothetical protein